MNREIDIIRKEKSEKTDKYGKHWDVLVVRRIGEDGKESEWKYNLFGVKASDFPDSGKVMVQMKTSKVGDREYENISGVAVKEVSKAAPAVGIDDKSIRLEISKCAANVAMDVFSGDHGKPMSDIADAVATLYKVMEDQIDNYVFERGK